MTVELFGIGDPRMVIAIRIRFNVFVDEQHVPPDLEIDEHDRDDMAALHAIVRAENGTPIAAGRLFVCDAQTVQIGRMAVAAEARGSGAGRVLLEALMNAARERGFTHACLDAQDHAIGFYAKFGFTPDGAPHDDAGIPHQPMRCTL